MNRVVHAVHQCMQLSAHCAPSARPYVSSMCPVAARVLVEEYTHEADRFFPRSRRHARHGARGRGAAGRQRRCGQGSTIAVRSPGRISVRIGERGAELLGTPCWQIIAPAHAGHDRDPEAQTGGPWHRSATASDGGQRRRRGSRGAVAALTAPDCSGYLHPGGAGASVTPRQDSGRIIPGSVGPRPVVRWVRSMSIRARRGKGTCRRPE